MLMTFPDNAKLGGITNTLRGGAGGGGTGTRNDHLFTEEERDNWLKGNVIVQRATSLT